MTIYQFTALNHQQQASLAWKGTYLECRVDASYNILLFAIGSFYVELYHSPRSGNIDRITPFTATGYLQPYLDKVTLNALMA